MRLKLYYVNVWNHGYGIDYLVCFAESLEEAIKIFKDNTEREINENDIYCQNVVKGFVDRFEYVE